jgi:HAMP domain-containing protein
MLDSRRMAQLGSDSATFPTGGFFHGVGLIGLNFCSLYVLIWNDKPTRELATADPEADGKAGR